MKKAKLISITVICVLALIIILQNTESVDTKLLFLTVPMSRALLLIITFTMGFVAGLITPYVLKRSGKKKGGE